MNDRPARRWPRFTITVNVVAFMLALTLFVAVFGIVSGVIIQIAITGNNPPLSGTTAQVIDSALTGVIGILGSYIGYSLRGRHDEQNGNGAGDER